MVGVFTWVCYFSAKFRFSVSVARTAYQQDKIKGSEILDTIWHNLNYERMTFFHWYKGEQMQYLGTQGATLLVRKIPEPNPKRFDIGDVVVLKDPTNLANLLVRRVVATEGWMMASTDEKDIPFGLVENQCWVLADNKRLDYKEAHDCRSFGPLYVPYIVGRAIYSLRSAVDHGPVKNSRRSIMQDLPVLRVELDIDEMTQNHKA